MHVFCTQCGGRVPEFGLDWRTERARCRICRAEFSLIPFRQQQARSRAEPLRPQPASCTVTTLADGVLIERRWRRSEYAWLLVAGLVLLVIGLGAVCATPAGLMSVGLAGWVLYTAAAGLLNRTQVRIASGMLHIAHGPLPWPGNRTWPGRQIAQLYCRRRLQGARRRLHEVYEVCAVTVDRGSIRLLGPLRDPDEALFLENQIERALGIVDQPVAGGYPG